MKNWSLTSTFYLRQQPNAVPFILSVYLSQNAVYELVYQNEKAMIYRHHIVE